MKKIQYITNISAYTIVIILVDNFDHSDNHSDNKINKIRKGIKNPHESKSALPIILRPVCRIHKA